jgi:hypothetical protein
VTDRIAFGLCLALLFVWSLPGTIALRAVLMLAALLLLARRVASADFCGNVRAHWLPLGLLAVLTLWLLLQALFLSGETRWALDELLGQWLPALLALMLGLLLAGTSAQPATAIVLVLAAMAAIAVGQSLWSWLAGGQLLTEQVPLTGGKLEMSFVVNLLLAFLTVDLFCRATRRAALLRAPVAATLGILLLALASAFLAGARNGIVGVFFLSFSAVSLFVFDQRRRLGVARTLLAAVVVVVALFAFGDAHYRSDPRWQKLDESAAIAWDIDRHATWLDAAGQPWPKLADGSEVDPSAYIRIAFIHGGLRLIADHPLGYGYGRNAFVHALRQAHPEARLGHAHSGWIDLGVGGGIPALLLWAAFLGSLAWRGWRTFFAAGNPHALVLFFIAAGYGGRMMLDSVNKDHMIQMFMFLAGLLLVLTSTPRAAARP